MGVRQKLKTDSQCEFVLLRSLTPARLIRHKRIMNDEAYVNQLLRITLLALIFRQITSTGSSSSFLVLLSERV